MRDKMIVITGGFGALARGVREAALTQGARVALIDYAPTPAEFTNDLILLFSRRPLLPTPSVSTYATAEQKAESMDPGPRTQAAMQRKVP